MPETRIPPTEAMPTPLRISAPVPVPAANGSRHADRDQCRGVQRIADRLHEEQADDDRQGPGDAHDQQGAQIVEEQEQDRCREQDSLADVDPSALIVRVDKRPVIFDPDQFHAARQFGV